MTTILVTGATGFVGSALIRRLLLDNVRLRAAVLPGEDAGHMPDEVARVIVEPLSDITDYAAAVMDVDVVIHLAARVHIMCETAADPLPAFRMVNLHGSERLARQAARAGVKRFVFMSTIGVNGENSGERSYLESDRPNPHNPYSVSKYEAECALQDISKHTAMEVVILRAPLVYGPGNPGNFFSLLRIVSKGLPLPFASVTNRRSLIYVENLAAALASCAKHAAAAGKTYLVGDDENISTPELIRRTASALGVPARLFPVPAPLMLLFAGVVGKQVMANRLLGSLTVDSSKIRRELGWSPLITMDEGLRATAEWFKREYGDGVVKEVTS